MSTQTRRPERSTIFGAILAYAFPISASAWHAAHALATSAGAHMCSAGVFAGVASPAGAARQITDSAGGLARNRESPGCAVDGTAYVLKSTNAEMEKHVPATPGG